MIFVMMCVITVLASDLHVINYNFLHLAYMCDFI